MSRIRANISATAISTFWGALLAISFANAYRDLLSEEGFALIGFYITLLLLCAPFDAGLRQTLTRELARLAASKGNEQEMQNLTRTLEILYFVVAVFLGVLLVCLAPVLATHWFKPVTLSPPEMVSSLVLMGLSLAAYWPLQFYSGGLIGLEHQTLLARLNIVMQTIRYVGALLVLLWISRSPAAFFAWQALTSFAHTILTRFFLWRRLPAGPLRGRFQMVSLKRVWRFSAGVAGIIMIGSLLTNMDRIILSNGKFLSMEMFGCYSLAFIAASCLTRLVVPIQTALMPRFAAMASDSGKDQLAPLYHLSNQLVSIVVWAPVAVAVVFPREVLTVWTGDPTVVNQTYAVFRLLFPAMGALALMQMPWILQLGYGWTRLSFFGNLVSLFILPPLMILAVVYYHAAGAAGVLLLLYLARLLVICPLMHRKILQGHFWRWLLVDITLPGLSAFSVVIVSALLLPANITRWELLAWLGITLLTAFLASSLSTPLILSRIRRRMEKG